jgi:uncharacterized protein YxjI
MEIQFNKPRLWRANFEIAINGDSRFIATRKFPRLRDEIIMKDANGSELALIQQNWFWFKPSYSIWFTGGSIYLFETENVWHQIFCCSSSKEILQIVGHKKRRYSVFRGRRQIAAFWKDALTLFGQYRFYMVAEDDENPLLLTAILLSFQSMKRYYSGEVNTLEIDFGFAAEKQPFDTAWVEEQRKKCAVR